METWTIGGARPLQHDAQLVSLLARASGGPPGKRMRIGIRNTSGRIYRIVTTDGLTEFLALVDVFRSFRMRDELEREQHPRDGFDAIFAPP